MRAYSSQCCFLGLNVRFGEKHVRRKIHFSVIINFLSCYGWQGDFPPRISVSWGICLYKITVYFIQASLTDQSNQLLWNYPGANKTAAERNRIIFNRLKFLPCLLSQTCKKKMTPTLLELKILPHCKFTINFILSWTDGITSLFLGSNLWRRIKKSAVHFI